MLLIPNLSAARHAERFMVWSDDTVVAVQGNSFWIPRCSWSFIDPERSSAVFIRDLVFSPFIRSIFVTFEGWGGVYSASHVDAQEVSLVHTLGEGSLNGVNGVFAPSKRRGSPITTCLDCVDTLLAAGDAWGRIAVWNLTGTVSDPPLWVFGAHGKLGCFSVKVLSHFRICSSGEVQNEIKIWNLLMDTARVECVASITTSFLLSTPAFQFQSFVCAGTAEGGLVLWNLSSLHSQEVSHLVKKAVTCVVGTEKGFFVGDSLGNFALVDPTTGRSIKQGLLPKPVVGLCKKHLIMDFTTDISVLEIVHTTTVTKSTTTSHPQQEQQPLEQHTDIPLAASKLPSPLKAIPSVAPKQMLPKKSTVPRPAKPLWNQAKIKLPPSQQLQRHKRACECCTPSRSQSPPPAVGAKRQEQRPVLVENPQNDVNAGDTRVPSFCLANPTNNEYFLQKKGGNVFLKVVE